MSASEQPIVHTPGPWRVCDGREHGVETEDGVWICDCIETPGNASLIAAAPEMLELLQRLYNEIDEHFLCSGEDMSRSMRDAYNETMDFLSKVV